jgi:hypothetical protein
VSASLHVSSHNPLQLAGVLLDASGSTGPIAQYEFQYGDGVVETSTQPLATHGYRDTGNFQARVTVIGTSGQRAVSAPVSIHVRDGIPPVVSIGSPRPNQRMRLGAGGLTLSGRATDAGGVKRVQLAMQLVSSSRHFKTGGACIWYDAHVWLVLAGCGSPYWFDAHVAHGRWSFQIGSNALIPAGTYVVRVQAIDRAGNVSHYYAVSLRTILPFKLAR